MFEKHDKSRACSACRAEAPLPRVLQAALSFILTFPTMLVLDFSSTNPAVSLAQLGSLLCLRGNKGDPEPGVSLPCLPSL